MPPPLRAVGLDLTALFFMPPSRCGDSQSCRRALKVGGPAAYFPRGHIPRTPSCLRHGPLKRAWDNGSESLPSIGHRIKIAYSPFILWPVFQQYYVFYGHRMNNDLSISILWPVGRIDYEARGGKGRFRSELAKKGCGWACAGRGGRRKGAGGLGRGPDEAMTAPCSTNVPGPRGPDKEEFAVKLPVPLPFSLA